MRQLSKNGSLIRPLSWGFGITAAAMFGYCAFVEPFRLEFAYKKLPIIGLPSYLIGKLLVQISDIHIDRLASRSYFAKTFTKISSLKPAFVAYTGDFVTAYDPTFKLFDTVMKDAPKGSLGTVGVLGNHDYGRFHNNAKAANQLVDRLEQLDITILRNEVVTVAGLQFGGVDDLWHGQIDIEQTIKKLDPSRPTIILCHNPDGVDLPGWDSYQGWILSGHTHGGQIKFPGLPPLVLSVKNRSYDKGEKHLPDGRTLYINRGVGTAFRLRFNVRPEITVFQLDRA